MSATPEIVPLTVTDHALLMGERLARRQGLAGLSAAFHVHFRGGIDLARLDASVRRLVERWPLLTARLAPRPRLGWVGTDTRGLTIRQEAFASDSDAEVAGAAERLLAEPFDLAVEPPVRLKVLHRPGGCDVLTMHVSHILMDGHGLAVLARQLLDPDRIPPVSVDVSPADLAGDTLRKTSLAERLRAIGSTLRTRRQARPVTLPRRASAPAASSGGRITLRWIDETAAAVVRKRTKAIPLANLTLVAAASGLRTLSRYARAPLPPSSVYEMPLAYNGRSRADRQAIFHNVSSRLVLRARPDELQERDALVRRLVSQMRSQMHDNDMAGSFQIASFVGAVDRYAPWLVDLLFRRPRPRSLRVAAWGQVVAPGQPALGATVDFAWGHTVCSGVSVELIDVVDRMLVVFMHSPDTLSDDEGARFLDEWIEDLCRP